MMERIGPDQSVSDVVFFGIETNGDWCAMLSGEAGLDGEPNVTP